MKILFAYTLDYLRRNRRSSLAIMVAILMTATMMSALCGVLYNTHVDNLRMVLRETGNWHGELYDNTKGNLLSTIETFDSIEATLIKGDWKVGKIDDPRRDYLVWRDANADYWQSMPEGDVAILEGRTPTHSGEIAISKQYFEHHPELKLGDNLTLPVGNRIAENGSIVGPQNAAQQGEQFEQTDTVTLTVVGTLDFTTSSAVPAYTALGFLDPKSILPDDDLTIYFRFDGIGDTYKELPKIAAAVGHQQDEYGEYLIRYNSEYLLRMGVIPTNRIDLNDLWFIAQKPLMFTIMGMMVVGLFVLVIHNAFALSSSSRLTQLGIFASVGATPRQIKRSVVMEALLLTAVPLPLGLMLGQGAVALLLWFVNTEATPGYSEPMTFVLGWQSVLPAIILALLTVWWSALIPARKIARMSPIVAIRQGGAENLKKQGKFSIAKFGKLFGLNGELAANALQARKKSYRTATVSLTLSFLTLGCFLCINSASAASNAVYQSDAQNWAEQDIIVTLHNVETLEDLDIIHNRISKLNGVTSAKWYSTLNTAVWLPEKGGFSSDFEDKGGFPAIEEKLFGAQIPLQRDGQRRVGIEILGLDDATFADYCTILGIDPAPFYDENQLRGILYHTVNDITTSTKRNPVPIPLFHIEQGDTMTLLEATRDSADGNFTFDMEVAAIADQMPPIGSDILYSGYNAVQVMPISQTRNISGHFTGSKSMSVRGVVQVDDPAKISPTRLEAEEICDRYFGSGDYSLFDENEYYKNDSAAKGIVAMVFGFIAGLLAIIGLSNAWSTVRGILNVRRREVAMLRSMGLPPKGLRRMLSLEAVMLGLTPILLSVPLVIALQCVFISINEVSFLEWLPYSPWLSLLVYAVAVLTVTVAAYVIGGRKLLDENIIEAIKMDSI